MYEELRLKYRSFKGFKTGTSLRLLIDVEKVLSENQRLELNDWGVSTLEEFCEWYSKNNNNDMLVTLGPARLEQVMNACEKYLSEEEKVHLKK